MCRGLRLYLHMRSSIVRQLKDWRQNHDLVLIIIRGSDRATRQIAIEEAVGVEMVLEESRQYTGHKCTIAAEYCDALVQGVHHQQIASSINSDIIWASQLSL